MSRYHQTGKPKDLWPEGAHALERHAYRRLGNTDTGDSFRNENADSLFL